MGFPLLRKRLFHARNFLDPTVVHWDPTSSCDGFPVGLQFACVNPPHSGFAFIHQEGEQRTLFSSELLPARLTVWDLSGIIFSSFGGQVLWHIRYCSVTWVPKAKPAVLHFTWYPTWTAFGGAASSGESTSAFLKSWSNYCHILWQSAGPAGVVTPWIFRQRRMAAL